MKLAEIKTLIESSGIPTFYRHAPIGQKLPFIDYYVDNDNNVSADDVVYVKINSVTIDLYVGKKDIQLEEKIEKVLDDAGIFWQKTETYDDTEKFFIEEYSMEVTNG